MAPPGCGSSSRKLCTSIHLLTECCIVQNENAPANKSTRGDVKSFLRCVDVDTEATAFEADFRNRLLACQVQGEFLSRAYVAASMKRRKSRQRQADLGLCLYRLLLLRLDNLRRPSSAKTPSSSKTKRIILQGTIRHCTGMSRKRRWLGCVIPLTCSL